MQVLLNFKTLCTKCNLQCIYELIIHGHLHPSTFNKISLLDLSENVSLNAIQTLWFVIITLNANVKCSAFINLCINNLQVDGLHLKQTIIYECFHLHLQVLTLVHKWKTLASPNTSLNSAASAQITFKLGSSVNERSKVLRITSEIWPIIMCFEALKPPLLTSRVNSGLSRISSRGISIFGLPASICLVFNLPFRLPSQRR